MARITYDPHWNYKWMFQGLRIFMSNHGDGGHNWCHIMGWRQWRVTSARELKFSPCMVFEDRSPQGKCGRILGIP